MALAIGFALGITWTAAVDDGQLINTKSKSGETTQIFSQVLTVDIRHVNLIIVTNLENKRLFPLIHLPLKLMAPSQVLFLPILFRDSVEPDHPWVISCI